MQFLKTKIRQRLSSLDFFIANTVVFKLIHGKMYGKFVCQHYVLLSIKRLNFFQVSELMGC